MRPLDITHLGSHMPNLEVSPQLPTHPIHTPSVGALKQRQPNKPHVTSEALIQSSTGCSTACQVKLYITQVCLQLIMHLFIKLCYCFIISSYHIPDYCPLLCPPVSFKGSQSWFSLSKAYLKDFNNVNRGSSLCCEYTVAQYYHLLLCK